MTTEIELSALSYSVLILLVVITLKALVTHFVKHEPLRFFQFYCLQLANKVNKRENSSQQQKIAGLVAICVTLVPLAVILWLFEAFVEVAYLWQGLLLYFALGPFGIKQDNLKIAQALVAKQNYVAKQTLNSWVLRDTEQLSPLGISKAAIEMQLLRALQQGYVVVFLYLLIGPLAALSYRLVLEMHYSWNPKLPQFVAFGRAASDIVNLCQWLPVRVFSSILLLTSVGKNFRLFWRLSSADFWKLNNNFALKLLALSLEIKLGGVAQYEKNKLRRNSFNDLAKQPQATDIVHANKLIKYIMMLSLFCLIGFTTCLLFL